MYFKREELKKFRSLSGPLIDVRSPSEYYKGHLPNSYNIPIFDDFERSRVGTIYKKNGRDKAIEEGLVIIEKKIQDLINNLFECINNYRIENKKDNYKGQNIKVYCARGGMRSLSVSWLLRQFKLDVVTLKGGYKSYRKWSLESLSKKWNIVVIGGKTGTGKTKLLKLFKKQNYQTVDLEKFASHRGSTFGGLGMGNQPQNEDFENKISEELNKFNQDNSIFVEAESANIGRCKIPHEFFKQMKNSLRIEVIRSESNRLEELISTYSIFNEDELIEAVLRIKKRLGPQRTKVAIESIKMQKWDMVCKSVLEYYDKCYEYEKDGKKNIKSIDLTDLTYDKNILELIIGLL